MKQKIIKYTLFFLALFAASLIRLQARAAETITIQETEGVQLIYTLSGDEVYEVTLSKENELKILGKHTAGKAYVSYQTVGFVFTDRPADGKLSSYLKQNKPAYIIRFDDMTKSYVNGQVQGEYRITTYTFPEDIIKKLFESFGFSTEDGREHTIYINNIFRVVEYPDGREKPFVYADEMVHYDRESIVNARPWTEATRNRLGHYYDMKLSISIQSRDSMQPELTNKEQPPNSSPDTGNAEVPDTENTELPDSDEQEQTEPELILPGAKAGFVSTGYDCAAAIPGGEAVTAYVFAGRYLISGSFQQHYGSQTYSVTVRKEYVHPEDETIRITREEHCPVSRSYSYWTIDDFMCYRLEYAQLKNQALGTVTLQPVFGNKQVICRRYGSSASHLSSPGQWITLEPGILLEDGTVPEEDFQAIAEAMTGSVYARSDCLSIDGRVILSDQYSGSSGASPSAYVLQQLEKEQVRLEQPGLMLERELANECYASGGVLYYRALLEPQGGGATGSNKTVQRATLQVNPITVHTPVVCLPQLSCDNRQYVQLINPEETAIPLVLDSATALNDFTLRISNQGAHIEKKGYGSRDYSSYVKQKDSKPDGSGSVRNEVRFPFDIMVDVANDLDTSNDICHPQWEWLTIGTQAQRFYLPGGACEGIYRCELRSVAGNATEERMSASEDRANCSRENYVAKNSFLVQISGRMYGFCVTDISGSDWEEVFQKEFAYFSGTNDSYGKKVHEEKLTLPLMDGMHPVYKNRGAVRAGSMVSYQLTTTGQLPEEGFVRVQVRCFSPDNGTEAELYYVLPENEKKLRTMDTLLYPVKEPGKAENQQLWSGTLILPEEIWAAKKGSNIKAHLMKNGLDGTDAFWLDQEELLVNVQIELCRPDGTAVLSYENSRNATLGYNNMWKTEGATRSRRDSRGKEYTLKYGDIFLINRSRRVSDSNRVQLLY